MKGTVEMKNQGLGQRLIRYVCIFLGNLLLAFGVAAFAIPHSLALTGVNGIARNLEHFLGLDMALAILVINLAAFLAGYICMGKEFALNTVISTVLYPIAFRVLSQMSGLAALTTDRLLATLLSGIFFGLGIGLVMRVGVSTGGMDIPPLVLNKKFQIPVVVSMYGIEVASLMVQLTYSSSEQVLYAVISTLVTGTVLNQVLVYGNGNIQTMIISKEYERMSSYIQEHLGHGCTLVPVETGYLHEQQMAVLSVLPARELGRLRQGIQQLDPLAFMVVTNAREVRGIGFTLDRAVRTLIKDK